MGAVRSFGALVGVLGLALVVGCSNAAPDADEAPDASPAADKNPGLNAQWSVPVTDSFGEIELAQVVGDHVVVAFAAGIAVLDRATGEQRWATAAEFPIQAHKGQGVRVTPDAVVVLRAPSSGTRGPGTAVAYDIDNGNQLTTRPYDTDHDEYAITGNTMVVKYQFGDTESRTYAIEAVDLKSGRRLWKKTYDTFHPHIVKSPQERQASAIVQSRDPLLAAGATRLLLDGYEKGGDRPTPAVRIVDVRTGRTAGGPYASPDGRDLAILDDERYAFWDDDPASGCKTKVTGYGVADGKQDWQLTAGLWRNGAGGRECVPYWRPVMLEDRLLTYTPDEKPVVVEPESGTTTWTGPKGLYPIGLSGDLLVGRDSGGDTVAAYDVTSGRQRWQVSVPSQAITSDYDTVAGEYAILSTGYGKVTLYPLDGGKPRPCAGDNEVAGAGDGWLVTTVQDATNAERTQLRYFPL